MSEPSSSCQKLNNRTGEKVKQQTPCLKIESGSSQQMPETKPVHLAPKALENSSGWATVVEEKTNTRFKIPIESDNSLSLSTVLSVFPTTCGMTYFVPECSHKQWIVRFNNKLMPPPNGWGNTVYYCVSAGQDVSWQYDFCSCVYEKAKQQAAASLSFRRINPLIFVAMAKDVHKCKTEDSETATKVLALIKKIERYKIKGRRKAKIQKLIKKLKKYNFDYSEMSDETIHLQSKQNLTVKKNNAKNILANPGVGNGNQDKPVGKTDNISKNNLDLQAAVSKIKKEGSKSSSSVLNRAEKAVPGSRQIVARPSHLVRVVSDSNIPRVNPCSLHSSSPAEKAAGLINNVLKFVGNNECLFPQPNDYARFPQALARQSGEPTGVTAAVNYVLHGSGVDGKILPWSAPNRMSQSQSWESLIADNSEMDFESCAYPEVIGDDSTAESEMSTSLIVNGKEMKGGQCSDIVIHNLSHGVMESHLLKYFTAYGEVKFLEIRTDISGGRTGFVQFQEAPVQHKELSNVYHFIGGYWCFVQLY